MPQPGSRTKVCFACQKEKLPTEGKVGRNGGWRCFECLKKLKPPYQKGYLSQLAFGRRRG